MIIFGVITFGALIGVPAFAILYGYTWLDWTMFGLLYVVTGLGITVGYHRLLAHRSFACPNWVKTGFLIAGAWALQNSVLKWGRQTISATTLTPTKSRIHTTLSRDFGTATVDGCFSVTPMRIRNTQAAYGKTQS